jgi:hypothetical protein
MYLVYFVVWAVTKMSKRTSYDKNYRLDVHPRPCLSCGRGFTSGRVFTICGRVRASARGQASRGQWAAQTWGRIRADAGLGRAEFLGFMTIKEGALPLFPHFQPFPVE